MRELVATHVGCSQHARIGSRPLLLPPSTTARASSHLIMFLSSDDDEPVDDVVFFGDAAALTAYGVVQGVVDVLLSPFAASDPEMFTNDLPLENPLAQGTLVALVFIVLARLCGSYSFERTRRLPDALVAVAIPWLASKSITLTAVVSAPRAARPEHYLHLGT